MPLQCCLLLAGVRPPCFAEPWNLPLVCLCSWWGLTELELESSRNPTTLIPRRIHGTYTQPLNTELVPACSALSASQAFPSQAETEVLSCSNQLEVRRPDCLGEGCPGLSLDHREVFLFVLQLHEWQGNPDKCELKKE